MGVVVDNFYFLIFKFLTFFWEYIVMKIYRGVEVSNPSLAELEKLLAEKKRVYSLHEGRYQLIVSIYVVSGVKYAKTGDGDYHAITKIVWYL